LGFLGSFDQFFDDMTRRRLIGIAHAQVDDILAAAARFYFHCVYDTENVWRQSLDPGEPLRHYDLFLFNELSF
jgi:hypothetical protein